MRHISLIGILPFVLLADLPAQAQQTSLDPDQIGQIFCLSSPGHHMAAVEGLLSYELNQLVQEAWEKNAAFEEANPGDKPPLGDGLPWRTWPDYADGCTVDDSLVERESADVLINYTFS